MLEKESGIAQHQTGNNSGVIHSGLCYKPGSLKAKLGTAGATSMRRFAEENGVSVEICGKLVVATELSQVPALQELHRRGQSNGVPCRMISSEKAKAYDRTSSPGAGHGPGRDRSRLADHRCDA